MNETKYQIPIKQEMKRVTVLSKAGLKTIGRCKADMSQYKVCLWECLMESMEDPNYISSFAQTKLNRETLN